MKKIFILLSVALFVLSCKVTDPGDPSIPDEGNFNILDNISAIQRAYNLTIDDNMLFVSDGYGRVTVVDAFVPWSLERLSSYQLDNDSNERIYQTLRDSRNVLFCSHGTNGMYALNTSNPLSISTISNNRLFSFALMEQTVCTHLIPQILSR
jgi:hypothetical protein